MQYILKDIQYIHDTAQCTAMEPWDQISTWLHQIFFWIFIHVEEQYYQNLQLWAVHKGRLQSRGGRGENACQIFWTHMPTSFHQEWPIDQNWQSGLFPFQITNQNNH